MCSAEGVRGVRGGGARGARQRGAALAPVHGVRARGRPPRAAPRRTAALPHRAQEPLLLLGRHERRAAGTAPLAHICHMPTFIPYLINLLLL